MKRCKFCNREIYSNDLCRYHLKAYNSLKEGYATWQKAYKGLTWHEYLEKIIELRETGAWVKDIIRSELSRNNILN